MAAVACYFGGWPALRDMRASEFVASVAYLRREKSEHIRSMALAVRAGQTEEKQWRRFLRTMEGE